MRSGNIFAKIEILPSAFLAFPAIFSFGRKIFAFRKKMLTKAPFRVNWLFFLQ